MTTSPISSPQPTASGPPRRLRIAAASDLHYGEAGTDYQRYADELVRGLNEAHARDPFDLVVLNGDLAHAPEYLADVRAAVERLTPPFLAVQGNHDEATESQWRDVWGHGFNTTVQVNGVRIVAAGTSDAQGTYLCADRDWLGDQLREAGEAPVLVVMHITPVKWTRHGIDCPAVTRLLAESPSVLAVLNAHDHDEFEIKERHGVPYLFDGRAGGHWGTPWRGWRELELFADRTIETWVTDGTTVHSRATLKPAARKVGTDPFPCQDGPGSGCGTEVGTDPIPCQQHDPGCSARK